MNFVNKFQNQNINDNDYWNNDLIIDNDVDVNVDINIDNDIDNDIDVDINNDNDNLDLSDLDNFLDSSRTKSDNDLLQLELFESKIPKELSKEKKMSLLIVVLLQMVFSNNNVKLDKIFNFLNKKKIIDLEVTKKKYFGIRHSLSMLIESVNNLNNLSNLSNFKSNTNFNNDLEFENFSLQNYTNKYRTNFNQIKLLGQGAYGSVFKVFHKYEKKFYAIKKIFITKDIVKDNYNIFREIQIYSELTNDNIVRYYSSWVDIDFESIIEYNNNQTNLEDFEPIDYICPILFIQMELCDFTLKDYLLTYSHDDKIENKINIIIQIIEGLKYLENKNIIHRDIKPDNIFLITDKQNPNNYIVKLGDFGLCKKYLDLANNNLSNKKLSNNLFLDNIITNKNQIIPINELFEVKKISNSKQNISETIIEIDKKGIEYYNSLSSYVGTGIYRAPEISTGNYDKQIDIYSLGIIILELFVNFKTHSEKIYTICKIMKKENILVDFDSKINYNKQIIHIINCCICKNPNDRISLDLIKELFENTQSNNLNNFNK